jgi:hypothetical protein
VAKVGLATYNSSEDDVLKVRLCTKMCNACAAMFGFGIAIFQSVQVS